MGIDQFLLNYKTQFMKQELTTIRDQQKETWNKFSGGWEKWEEFTMNFLQPMGDAIIGELDLKANDKVLDAACGTGEPGLTIAAMVKGGKVTGTDVADQMLGIARAHATARHISNYETRVCDVCELPFDEDSFDKISCRMGFMFFPDMQLASDEMFRVLKPGGKIATAVWSTPDKNAWVTNIMGVLNKSMQVPPPPPGAPGMFRCGTPGFIKDIMEKSGFKNIKEHEINGTVVYKDFDFMWTMMNEVAAPVVSALSKADEAMREKLKNEVRQANEQHTTDKGIELSYGALIISGSK